MLFTHGRKVAACAALFVLATTGVAACGGDDDSASSPSLCDDSQALQFRALSAASVALEGGGIGSPPKGGGVGERRVALGVRYLAATAPVPASSWPTLARFT